jgi:hypothetical protein
LFDGVGLENWVCRSKSELDGRRLDPSPFVSFKAPPADWSSLLT